MSKDIIITVRLDDTTQKEINLLKKIIKENTEISISTSELIRVAISRMLKSQITENLP